jgi:arylsulfatase A-like enzyme
MQTLRRFGLEDNTLVIFTADQGLAGGHGGFWGMGDHTRPLTAFDWTTWVPLIYRHPGRVNAGQRNERLTSSLDLLPTVASYAGLELPANLPGRDLTPWLEGRTVEWDDTVFFEFENVRSIRTTEWKYIERIYQQPDELYDLRKDPGERLNLAGRPAHASVQAELRKRMYAFFDRYANPKWDLWKGGKSKADLITARFFGIPNPYRPAAYAPGPGEGRASGNLR